MLPLSEARSARLSCGVRTDPDRARGTTDAALRREMPPTDRAILRNLIIVMIVSTGGGVALGTSCLGRDRARPSPSAALEKSGTPARASSAPASPVGPTTIMSAQINRGRPPVGMPPQRMAEPPDVFEPSFPHSPMPTPMFRGGSPAPMPMASPPPNTGPLGTQHPGAMPPSPGVVPPATVQPSPHRTPPQGLGAGAAPLVTEPPPFSASAPAPRGEAGAGSFATEHPPQPVPPPH